MTETQTESSARDRRLAWGILGTGNIARTFARGVQASQTGHLVAVGSRTQQSADRFGDSFDIPRRHASYDALLADPEVEAIYIAVPNHLHARWTVRAAEAGKHILCEKPLATNHAEAMTAIQAARENDVFLMEAFMYRCHPQTARLVELIREGAIGKVRLIQAHFSYDMKGPRENVRQSNPAAGGGIMDVGCYTASMARLVAGAALGQPFADPIIDRDGYRSRVALDAEAYINTDNRVDEWSMALVRFPGEIIASLTTGIQVKVDNALRIWGSDGHIIVPNPWFPGDPRHGGEESARILLYREGNEEPEEIVVPGGDVPLYGIEADTVARHIANRQAPRPCMRWDDSLGNMLTLDAWRAAVGVVFDAERPEALTLPTSGRPLAPRADAPMRYGEVKGVGKPVSRLVMGTMVFKPGTVPLARALLDRFVEMGGTAIDTAHVYNCEETVGHWLTLSGVRDQMVVIGKGMRNPGDGVATLTSQLYGTLDKLQTDYLDLYLMHADDPAVPVGDLVEVLNEHLNAGRIHAYGGSNWSIARIEAANAYAESRGLVGFAASSPNLSLALWNEPMWVGCISASDPESRAWYERTQMPLFAWSSQATGFFTGRYAPKDREQPALANIVRTWFNKANFVRLERVQALAQQKGVTPAQVALAYVLRQPLDVYALIGPQTIDELNESLPALNVELSADEMRWLNLERGTRPE